jgi:hypothetical protein
MKASTDAPGRGQGHWPRSGPGAGPGWPAAAPPWRASDHGRDLDERALASVIIEICTINAFNRLNVTARQPSGQKW